MLCDLCQLGGLHDAHRNTNTRARAALAVHAKTVATIEIGFALHTKAIIAIAVVILRAIAVGVAAIDAAFTAGSLVRYDATCARSAVGVGCALAWRRRWRGMRTATRRISRGARHATVAVSIERTRWSVWCNGGQYRVGSTLAGRRFSTFGYLVRTGGQH